MLDQAIRRIALVAVAFAGLAYIRPAQAAPGGGNQVNILSILPQRPGTDYTAAINGALASGKVLLMPNTGKPYVVTDSIRFKVAGTGLIGQKGTTIVFNHRKTIFSVTAPNVTLENITFDGKGLGPVPKGEGYCLSPNFRWIGGGMLYGGPFFIQPGCNNAVISGIKEIYNSSTAFTVQASNVTIEKSEFENNVGFGIRATSPATNFHFNGNWTNANGLELIGIVHGAVGGEVMNNRAIGTGDNCISISGDRVRVVGNIAKQCLGFGIGVFGEDNVIDHNNVQDNGQVNNPGARPISFWNGTTKPVFHCPGYSTAKHAGIIVVPGGGRGLHNAVTNNSVSDDQPRPTQGGIDPRSYNGNSIAGNSIGRTN